MILPNALPLRACAIAAAVATASGTIAGWKLHDALIHRPHLAADAKAARKVAEAARAAEARGSTIATTVRDANDGRQAEIRTVTRTLLKEVPRYVAATLPCPAPVDPAPPGAPDRRIVADVSVGFGLLHDAAARGTGLPAAAGVDLDAARGTGLPSAAATIVGNYGLCRSWRAEAVSWRDWYARQSAIWPVKPARPTSVASIPVH